MEMTILVISLVAMFVVCTVDTIGKRRLYVKTAAGK